GNSALSSGGGIFSYDGSLSIIDSNIANNDAASNTLFSFEENAGGGIYSSTGLTLTNSSVSRNSSERGGGIFVVGSNSVEISDSTLENNFSYNGSGGGIEIDGSSTVGISTSTISNNTASTNSLGGGGITANGSGVVEISASIISSNTAVLNDDTLPVNTGGGGIEINDSREVRISTSTISNILSLAMVVA
ncbi:MAG: right-handed parallel beta-helix repeat-containing protein, partial [Cyanobacteria bacterium J06641_5]